MVWRWQYYRNWEYLPCTETLPTRHRTLPCGTVRGSWSWRDTSKPRPMVRRWNVWVTWSWSRKFRIWPRFGGLAVFGPVRNFESTIAISGQLIADHVRTNLVLSGTWKGRLQLQWAPPRTRSFSILGCANYKITHLRNTHSAEHGYSRGFHTPISTLHIFDNHLCGPNPRESSLNVGQMVADGNTLLTVC